MIIPIVVSLTQVLKVIYYYIIMVLEQVHDSAAFSCLFHNNLSFQIIMEETRKSAAG